MDSTYFANLLIEWIDPWWWVAFSSALFFLFMMGTKPMFIKDDHGLVEIIQIRIRQVLAIGIAALPTVYPLTLFCFAMVAYGMQSFELMGIVWEEFLLSAKKWWSMLAAAFIASFGIRFWLHRVVIIKLSNIWRRWWVKQSGDELSDIRIEESTLEPKNFDPREYFKEGKIFYGLDSANKPVYEDDEVFKKKNQKYIGPTQVGKGVELNTLLYQSVLKGWTTFAYNPKPDDFMEAALRQACNEAGRKLVVCDLNDGRPGKWAPFVGGEKRDRRARLHWAFGLGDTGTDADFYKSGERDIVDRILEKWDGRLESLKKELHNPEYYEETKRTRSYVNEWMALDSLNPQKGRGFDIARSIEENAVVLIYGSVDDDLIIKASTIMLMEMIQENKRLHSEGKKTNHLFSVVDEVKFLTSNQLAKSLATMLSKGANMVIAYQTINDLLDLPDKTADPKAVKQSTEVNAKNTLCYQAADSDTAEWAAKLSGTVYKSVTRMEKTEISDMGAETWEQGRTLNKMDEALIPENRMLMLPERVGAFYRPGKLTQLLFTCWIPIEPEFQKYIIGDNHPYKKESANTLEHKQPKAKKADQDNAEKQESRNTAEPTQIAEEPAKKDRPKQRQDKQGSKQNSKRKGQNNPNNQQPKKKKTNHDSKPKPSREIRDQIENEIDIGDLDPIESDSPTITLDNIDEAAETLDI